MAYWNLSRTSGTSGKPTAMWLAIITLFSAISVFAAPTVSRPSHAIPLKKKSNMVDSHGVVNPIFLQSQVSRVSSKLRRGFHAYHKNTGSRHLNDIRKQHRRETATISLADDDGTLWQGSAYVGSPPVLFSADFDTGSGDFFLPGSNCDATCNGHRKYATGRSLTAIDLRKPFTLSFGDGSLVSGNLFMDTVTIGGLTATGQTIGAATQYSSGFALNQFLPDGLIGMAFPELANFGTDPVFQNLIAQNQSTLPEFAFKLTTLDSELFLGGVNHDLYNGKFTQNPVTHTGFWQIDLEAVNIFDRATVTGKSAIIDTGTTLILGDLSSVATFYAAIDGSKPVPSRGDGFYSVPCNAIPDISMTFGGEEFAISAKTFNIGLVSRGSLDCIGGIAGADDLSEFWVVGDVFLQNVYTSFNVEKQLVGFANLA